MNATISRAPQELQLCLDSSKDKLTLTISGKFRPSHVGDFMGAIDGKLKTAVGITKFAFDLRGIDPVYNAAGRVFDLADHYFRSKRATVQIDIREEVYSTLSRLPKHERISASAGVPNAPGLWVRISQVDPKTVELKKSSPSELISLHAVEAPRTLLNCRGKITEVLDSEVTVTLFTPEEEIIGEFARTQFPPTELFPGMIFSYKATISEPGLTEVRIELVPEQEPSDEAMMDMAEEISQRLGKLDNEI